MIDHTTAAAAHPPSSEPALLLTEGALIASSYILRRQMVAAGDDLIWLAHDEVLGKDVTLHFLPASVRADARAIEILRQEIKRYRQLIHPQILRVYDLIEDRGCAAIVMDAFTGTPLSVLLARTSGAQFEPAQLRPWLAMLCRTLDDAHKIKLVHRDLSPVNVIVDDAGKVLVAKFGISRFIRDAIDRAADGNTPDPHLAYASPQQLDGERPAVADDVYGFGVLVFALLTGGPPFAGKDLATQILRKVPPSISARRAALKKNGALIPAAWEKTIAACLEKSAAQRPADMREVAARLDLELAAANGAAPVVTRSAPPSIVPSALTTLSRAAASKSAREAASMQPGAGKTVEAKAPPKDPPTERENGRSSASMEASPGKTKLASKFVKSDLDAAAIAARIEPKVGAPRKETVLITKSAPPPRPAIKKEAASPMTTAEALLPEDYPGFELRRGSSFPLTTLAAGAVIIMIAVYGLFVLGPSTLESSPPRYFADVQQSDSFPPTDPAAPDGADVVTTGNPRIEPIAATNSTLLAAVALPDEKAFPTAEATPVETERKPDASLATAKTSEGARTSGTEPPRAAASPANAAPPAKPQLPAVASEVAAKSAAFERAQKEAEAAEKAQQEMLKAKEDADAKMAEAQKALAEKTKAVAPTLKAAEAAAILKKTREEETRAAEAAAEQARQIAAEKERAAEEARKALATTAKETAEKSALQQKAEAEINELQTGLEEKRKSAADAARVAAEAAARHEEMAATMKRTEQELAAARIAAQKAAEEAARIAAEKRKKIENEIAEAKAMFERKMAELENALKNAEAGISAPAAATTPVSSSEQNGSRSSSSSAPEKSLASPDASSDFPAAATPKKSAETLLAMKTEPGKGTSSADAHTAPSPLENSLGMKFVPVGDILFCVWQTRVKDFDTFAHATGLKSKIWKDPGFRQGPDHPVVNVTWREAVAFCKWLTAKEQKEGSLSPAQEYRLPSDLEWSKAVGLPEEAGKTPEARDMGVPDLYPWGTAWPPPSGAGNYTGEETGSDVAIKGFEDGFAWTAPVGSFAPNQFGLYDMGGNVWQWCLDSWNPETKDKVLRGASWYNGALRLSLLSSCRVHGAPDSSTDNYGFRCVIAPVESGRSAKR